MVQAPGGAGGGYFSYTQLEQLWVSAGGSAKIAPIMAAIAEAESGGNPQARNSSSGAAGLWQILGLPFSGNPYDPQTNARMAVAKYKSQGYDAWQTYTNGAYKKFVQGTTKSAPNYDKLGDDFVTDAGKYIGTPYVWGGDKPGGFDCSGLVYYVLGKLGVKNVPRTSEEQWAWVKRVSKSQLQPGDLVFYAGSDGTPASPGHVAIYSGTKDGKPQIIQAPQTGEDVQEIDMPSGAVGYGRIPDKGFGGPSTINPDIGQNLSGSMPSAQNSVAMSVLNALGGGGGIATWIADVANGKDPLTQVASAIDTLTLPFVKLADAIDWFLVPNHWIRLGCLFGGSAFTLMGIVTMTRTGKSGSVQIGGSYQGISPPNIPAPGGQIAPAIGIAEVTVGAVLLFFAFHNLPPSVNNFSNFTGFMAAQLQSGGKAG